MLVDIVIPFYGSVDYLATCVESVLQEDTDCFRVTVVDDSAPGPGAQEYLSGNADTRLRQVRNDRNLGLNRNFQRCLELVDAPYFVIMGYDDFILPGYFDSLEAAAAVPGWDIFQPGVTVVDASGRPVRPLADRVKSLIRPRPHDSYRLIDPQSAASGLCVGDWMYFPALCWRTASVRHIGFRPELRVALDLQLLFDVLTQGGQVLVGTEPVFAYRRHPANESSPVAMQGARFTEEATVYEWAHDTFRALGWTRSAHLARLRPTSRAHALLCAYQLWRAGDPEAAQRLLHVSLTAGAPI